MPNRFTATEKWQKAWFCALNSTNKLVWNYICDNCNNAGIWDINWPILEFHTGTPTPVNPAVFGVRDDLLPRVITLPNNRWFIPGFVLFQQKISNLSDLNPDNNSHKNIIYLLKKDGIYDVNLCSLITEGQSCPSNAPSLGHGRGPGKVEVRYSKGKDRGVGKGFNSFAPEPQKKLEKTADGIEIESEFEILWFKYPRRDGRKEAYKHFRASVTNQAQLAAITKALQNYIQHLSISKTDAKYIKKGSTWFNNWNDWENYEEPVSEINVKEQIREAFGIRG